MYTRYYVHFVLIICMKTKITIIINNKSSMSIKDSFNSALIKSRPYTLDFGFMTDALNFLIKNEESNLRYLSIY